MGGAARLIKDLRHPLLRSLHASLRQLTLLRKSLESSLAHDFLTLAQAVAYSGIVALFPALIVVAAVVAHWPSLPLRGQMAMVFMRVLPSDVWPLILTYFSSTHATPQTARGVLSALVVSVVGAGNVMSTFMEGFRRAYDLPLCAATFWQRRRRALLLVPLSLLPLALASGLVVFGRLLTDWLTRFASHDVQIVLALVSLLLRWSIALGGSVALIAQIYHLGTDVTHHVREYVHPMLGLRMERSWRNSLPGATVATVLWFASTLIFGWYVTRFANYSRVYGSLGAAIALLVWLYLIALSVVWGAEFNAQRALVTLAEREQPGDVEAAPAALDTLQVK